MRSGPRWVAAAAAAMALALASGVHADIPLEMHFDGHAIDLKEKPDVSCYSSTLDRWVGCRVQKTGTPGAYVVEGLASGKYRMYVSVDENPANPRRYPGDYEAQISFEITPTGPERLIVDLARLIHLTRPGDNARSLEGMLRGCATQPRFDTPKFSWGPVAKIDFAWDPIVTGAEYRYTLSARSCGRAAEQREIASGQTDVTAAALTLPPSRDNEYYVFRVEAWRHDRLVGDLYTHDSGAHSWNYRFRVRDTSLPAWAYAAAGAGLVLLLLGARRALSGADADVRRGRVRLLARSTMVALAIGAVAGGGYHYYQDRQQRRAETERAKLQAEQQARQREFIAAFVSVAPRPEWWDSVETPYRVDSLGDLLSAWQGFPRGDDGRGERQFFKAAYQGILDHPDDPQVAATGIDLLHWVTRDYPHRLGLARFGYDRYFQHRARTDNCANCMVGDTSQGLVQNLSQLYTASGRFDEAIAVCRRLIDERGDEVSPYKLAETWNQMAWAYWHKGEHSRAMSTVRDAITRYGATVRGEELKRTLARFEAEQERAATKPSPGDPGGK
jgi:tetratricopeptide (TPR) repeat protein